MLLKTQGNHWFSLLTIYLNKKFKNLYNQLKVSRTESLARMTATPLFMLPLSENDAWERSVPCLKLLMLLKALFPPLTIPPSMKPPSIISSITSPVVWEFCCLKPCVLLNPWFLFLEECVLLEVGWLLQNRTLLTAGFIPEDCELPKGDCNLVDCELPNAGRILIDCESPKPDWSLVDCELPNPGLNPWILRASEGLLLACLLSDATRNLPVT